MATLKTPSFKPGELLVIPIGGHRFGFARVIAADDNFGRFLEVYADISSNPEYHNPNPKVRDVAHLNTSSARKRWKSDRVQNIDLIVTQEMPVLFFGGFRSGWTICDKNQRTDIAPGLVTNADLRNKGYTNKVLWLAKNFEDLIEFDKPLVWPIEHD